MVITKIMGGLGNQMFQFSAGYATSKKRNTSLYMDLSWFNPSQVDDNITKRKFELHKFGLDQYILRDISIINKLNNNYNKYVTYINKKLGNDIRKIIEKPIEYTPIPDVKNKYIYLDGYWQSNMYFKEYEQDIRSIFLEPAKNFDVLNQSIAQRVSYKNSISIHIRRGDYVTNTQANTFHGLCSIDYYINAIEYLEKNNYINNDSEILLFSDDIDWARENFKVNYDIYYINHNSEEQSHFDLLLMSFCKHHIMANSSFSWWGAYLSKSEGKKIAPKSWYAGSSKDTSFMFPETWIRL